MHDKPETPLLTKPRYNINTNPIVIPFIPPKLTQYILFKSSSNFSQLLNASQLKYTKS